MTEPAPEKALSLMGKRKWPSSTVSTEDLSTLASRRRGFNYRVPEKDESPDDAKEGELCLFLEYFKIGLELPLPQFLIDFCNQTKLLPRMIMPNTLIILRGLFSFFSKWSVPWERENILSLITFSEREGVYYAQPKHSSEFKIIGLASSRHGWKDKYFFVNSKQPWPIHTSPVIPLPYSLKDGEVSSRVAELKNSYENRPFCLHVVTLEVTPIEEAKIKRRGPGLKAVVSKRQRLGKPAAEGTAETKLTESEESIRWSDIEPESTTIRRKLPIRQPQMRGSEGKGKAVIEEDSEEEDEEEEAAAVGVQAAQAEKLTSIPTTSTAVPEQQPGTSAATEEEGEPEFTIDKENKTMTLKQNLQQRYVPDFTPSKTPYAIGEMLLHPEDLEGMKRTPTQELGERGAHLAESTLLITKFLCERSKIAESSWAYARDRAHRMKGLAKSYKSKFNKSQEELTAVTMKASEDLASRDEEIQKLLSKEEEDKARLSKEIAEMKAALEQANKERDAAKASVSSIQAKHERELNMKNETIKAMKTAMEKTFSHSPAATTGDIEKDKIIADYKESDDFYMQMKHYGEYGFVLLKRHIQKNQLLPQATLDTLLYDKCIDEASDAESDNGAS